MTSFDEALAAFLGGSDRSVIHEKMLRLRRLLIELRGGSDAPGGAGRHAARGREPITAGALGKRRATSVR
jgi:hypothetical protein